MSTLEHPTKLAERARYWRLHGRTANAEALEAELAAAGRCVRCGRLLTASASVERSLGPECAARITRDEP
jgi:hypothetical protein